MRILYLSNKSAQKVSHICLNVILLLEVLHKLVEQVGRTFASGCNGCYTHLAPDCVSVRPDKQEPLISWFDGLVKYVLIVSALVLLTCVLNKIRSSGGIMVQMYFIMV